MFKLYLKSTGEEVNVYGNTMNKDGYPMFLIRKNNQWKYMSAKHFITKDETEYEKFIKKSNVYHFNKKDIETMNELIKSRINDETVCCGTCRNNPKYNDGYAPAHTCDICTSLDTDDYYMWEQLNEK